MSSATSVETVNDSTYSAEQFEETMEKSSVSSTPVDSESHESADQFTFDDEEDSIQSTATRSEHADDDDQDSDDEEEHLDDFDEEDDLSDEQGESESDAQTAFHSEDGDKSQPGEVLNVNLADSDSEESIPPPKEPVRDTNRKPGFSGRPSFRGRRPPSGMDTPPVRIQSRPPIPNQQRALLPSRNTGLVSSSGEDSSQFVSNWGFRSNLVDQNGNFQRATTELHNYIAMYRAKYTFYFDLVNGQYPQFVRTLTNGMEIWRMSFNVYSSGFNSFIAHLGEIHAFYQMEHVNNTLRWVYKDFNFYPNHMAYGFKVSSFDIADIHSRFVKFICLRDSIMKQFPYVSIQHKVFIGKKYEQNLRIMMGRLERVKLPNSPMPAITNHGDCVVERDEPVVSTSNNTSNSVSPPNEIRDRPMPFIRKDREFRSSNRDDHRPNFNGSFSRFNNKPFASNYNHRDGPSPPQMMARRPILSYVPRPATRGGHRGGGGRGNYNYHHA